MPTATKSQTDKQTLCIFIIIILVDHHVEDSMGKYRFDEPVIIASRGQWRDAREWITRFAVLLYCSVSSCSCGSNIYIHVKYWFVRAVKYLQNLVHWSKKFQIQNHTSKLFGFEKRISKKNFLSRKCWMRSGQVTYCGQYCVPFDRWILERVCHLWRKKNATTAWERCGSQIIIATWPGCSTYPRFTLKCTIYEYIKLSNLNSMKEVHT